MPKEFPFSEKEISDQELISALKHKGVNDPETYQLLRRWTEQEEKRVAVDPEASIEFNRRRAALYFESGYIEEALDVLGNARMQAWNEQRTELYNAIVAQMDEIELGNH